MIDPRHIEVVPILVDEWLGCYKSGWKGLIHDEAFAHPAKYARNLIGRIYAHVIAEGWISAGGRVVDPFGGVALGGLDAMRHGLRWTGCELEAKFHGLGNQNIALWNERFSRMPNWGTAVLLQGDSRKLAEVLAGDTYHSTTSDSSEDRPETLGFEERDPRLIISSPPYSGSQVNPGNVGNATNRRWGSESSLSDHNGDGYGEAVGQLGAMKEGDLQATLSISSPPYANDTVNDRNGIDLDKVKKPGGRNSQSRKMSGYGEASGQLGNLAISSPPYAAGCAHTGGDDPKPEHLKGGDYHGVGINLGISSPPYTTGDSAGPESLTSRKDGAAARMFKAQGWRDGGQVSEGNLASLDDKGFQAAISSPPYEAQDVNLFCTKNQGKRFDQLTEAEKEERKEATMGNYGYRNQSAMTEGQLSATRGEDFWSASRLILEQLYQVITPGGHAVFVVKAFVRDKKIVDFPGQWAQLCEAVGFRLLHDHHALLTEHYGTQQTMHGEDKHLTVARKSFFRRLAESKGSPKIDYENVLCFLRP